MELNTLLIIGCFLALLIILFRIMTLKGTDNSAQLIDLKNQLNELKNKQLEAQNQSLSQQQQLFTNTQEQMNRQLSSILGLVNENLTKTQGNINSQLSHTTNIIGEVQKKLGSLETTAKNIQDIGKDISSLQDILQAPKLRGNLGEFLLEELLKQIFPSGSYEMKYSFRNNTQVDAIIRIGGSIVPIDSKFPLESFVKMMNTENEAEKKAWRKDFIKSVKLRIDEIADNYINTDEGTFDFALMYIPAENVYYETIVTDSFTDKDYEIFNYAINKHVIPVSPNSFYAYLMAIVYGLKGFKIEQQAKTIIGELTSVQQAFGNFYTDFTMVGKHLNNATSRFNDSLRRADKLNDKITKITGVDIDLVESDAKIMIEEK